MYAYLVKSVLRAPVPAYCSDIISALSAHTENSKREHSYKLNIGQEFIYSIDYQYNSMLG